MDEFIYVSVVLCLQLCVDVSRLCTAGVFRDEEESVPPPPLSDIGDDWNINGPGRASNAQAHSLSNQEDLMA